MCRIYLSIKRDPQRFAYSDLAMSAIKGEEMETHELTVPVFDIGSRRHGSDDVVNLLQRRRATSAADITGMMPMMDRQPAMQ